MQTKNSTLIEQTAITKLKDALARSAVELLRQVLSTSDM